MWVLLTDNTNVDIDGGVGAGQVQLLAPPPAFRVVPGQLAFRAASSADSTGPGPATATIPVRRVGASPFSSTLDYTAVVLNVTGTCTRSSEGAAGAGPTSRSHSTWCLLDPTAIIHATHAGCTDAAACAAAVQGRGSLAYGPADQLQQAQVSVEWSALPPTAVVRVALQLDSVGNAQSAPSPPGGTTALSVFGTPYGTCPAGTMGPWQDVTQGGGAADGASGMPADASPPSCDGKRGARPAL